MFADLNTFISQKNSRKTRRESYLHKLAQIRAKMNDQLVNQNDEPSYNPQTSNNQPDQQNDLQEIDLLTKQNTFLKQELSRLQAIEHSKLNKFKSSIQQIKEQYLHKIKSINEFAKNEKQKFTAKFNELTQQLEKAKSKNSQFQQTNSMMEQEISQNNLLGEKYQQEIQKEYSTKLSDFALVFNSSQQKIKQMEDKMNDDQFIRSTLQDEQLIQSIRQSAEKAADDIERIYGDYKQLLQAKTDVYEQLNETNIMKQKQRANCEVLENKLKAIFEKLNEEKQIYLSENQKMNAQLLSVKTLLQKVMGAST